MTPSFVQSRSTESQPPRWRDIAPRFAAERDCLAAFLALETAELLDGIKPGNLVNVVNRPHSCDRNLYQMWRRFGPELMACTGLEVLELCDRGSSLLLFIYNPEALRSLLEDRRVIALLRRAGYPSVSAPHEVLDELVRRCNGRAFPHEIGIFLGYPLKDVAAFMGLAPLSFTCQGPWKIFGDPRPSLRVAEAHRACRSRMAWRVAACDNPRICLQKAA